MLTVYKYGFEMPKPTEQPTTPVATYLLMAAAAWWVWKKGWLSSLVGTTRTANPRRRVARRRSRRNPSGTVMEVRSRQGTVLGTVTELTGRPEGIVFKAKVALKYPSYFYKKQDAVDWVRKHTGRRD